MRIRDRAQVWSPDGDPAQLSDGGFLEQMAIAFRKERDQRGWRNHWVITRGLMKEIDRRSIFMRQGAHNHRKGYPMSTMREEFTLKDIIVLYLEKQRVAGRPATVSGLMEFIEDEWPGWISPREKLTDEIRGTGIPISPTGTILFEDRPLENPETEALFSNDEPDESRQSTDSSQCLAMPEPIFRTTAMGPASETTVLAKNHLLAEMRENGLSSDFVVVTPEMAADWIGTVEINRRSAMPSVNAYVRDMRKGDWIITHQGIAFDRDGCLIDGEHRLRAIVKSGIPQVLLVTKGLEKEARAAIDLGRKRAVADVLRMTMGDENITRNLVATVGLFGTQQGFLTKAARDTPSEISVILAEYLNSFVFASSTPHKIGFSSPVSAAIASAHAYGIDPDILGRFITILRDSTEANVHEYPYERTILRFRDVLTEGKNSKKIKGEGDTYRTEVYRKTERVIKAICDHETLKNICEPKYELFPVRKSIVRASVDDDRE